MVCGEDNSIMIYTERLDRVPFLVEKGKKLVARKSRRVRRREEGGSVSGDEIRAKIMAMLGNISSIDYLTQIYRFVKYIYIHKT